MEPWKPPQWAIEQRVERERAAERERKKAEAVHATASTVLPEVQIPEGGIVSSTANDSALKLAQRIEDIYRVPVAMPAKKDDDNQGAIIALLMAD